jgi:hypothetical protein
MRIELVGAGDTRTLIWAYQLGLVGWVGVGGSGGVGLGGDLLEDYQCGFYLGGGDIEVGY